MLNPAFIAAQAIDANLLKHLESLDFLYWHGRCNCFLRNAAWESSRIRKWSRLGGRKGHETKGSRFDGEQFSHRAVMADSDEARARRRLEQHRQHEHDRVQGR